MSTAERTGLPLEAGQRLSQPEFHARYAAMPARARAELIAGEVSIMPSPVGLDHAGFDSCGNLWVAYYSAHTPGTGSFTNGSIVIEAATEIQPDAMLAIWPVRGNVRRYGGILAGAPELVVEVAGSSLSDYTGRKLLAYERAGVLEYVVVALDAAEVRWHALRGGRFVLLEADADGLHRSEAFAGLWLDPAALLARDRSAILATLDRGLATAEHAEFVAGLGGRAEAEGGPR